MAGGAAVARAGGRVVLEVGGGEVDVGVAAAAAGGLDLDVGVVVVGVGR